MNEFSLSDFLGNGLNLYNTIQQGKNTTDQAKLQQQLAAQQALAAQSNSATIKNVLIWGSVIVTGIFLLIIVIKALKK